MVYQAFRFCLTWVQPSSDHHRIFRVSVSVRHVLWASQHQLLFSVFAGHFQTTHTAFGDTLLQSADFSAISRGTHGFLWCNGSYIYFRNKCAEATPSKSVEHDTRFGSLRSLFSVAVVEMWSFELISKQIVLPLEYCVLSNSWTRLETVLYFFSFRYKSCKRSTSRLRCVIN